MASKAVVDAVEARLATNGAWMSIDGNALPVIGMNTEGEAPADGRPHIEVTYPVANERQLTLGSPGSNQWKEDGAFRIIINERRGIGIARANGWAEELATLFRGVALASGAIQCFGASPPVINSGNDLGNYWQMSFVVAYWFFRIG